MSRDPLHVGGHSRPLAGGPATDPQGRVLDAISSVLERALVCDSVPELALACLEVAGALTKSQLGWLAQVTDEGKLEILAVHTPVPASDPRQQETVSRMLRDMEDHGFFPGILQEGEAVLINEGSPLLSMAPLANEHPPVTSLLGVPLRRGGRTVALMVLGNAEGGFLHEDQQAVEALAATMLEALTRKRVEEALRTSEKKFRELADNSTVGIVILSGERFVYINRAAAQIGGYSVQEVLGWTPKELFGILHPADAERVLTNLRGRLAGEPDIPRSYDLRIMTASGQTRHVSISASRWEQDGVPVVAVSLMNITDRMQMQTTLALADRMTSMGMLAAGVAHEINNPLTYVLYNLENLARNLPVLVDTVSLLRQRVSELQGEEEAAQVMASLGSRPAPADLEELVRQSQEALTGAQRVRDIVRDLRTFSHVGEDRCVPVSLNQIMETAINMAFNEIKYRAKLVKDYGRVPLILANEGRLAQVFLNLLVNAAQAIEEGDAEHHTIRVRTWSDGEEVLAEVSDTGMGIPAEDLGRLFDPFFTTKPVGVGSGLGLCICHKIVSGYGGRIEVQSAAGQGAQFLVHLPVRSEKQLPVEVRPAINLVTRPAGVRGRVLVVDDEKLVRTTIRRLLRSEHEVVLASSGEEAREILQADPEFDVILCDLIMPRVSGKELFAWVASHVPQLVERMIFMTGGAFTPSAGEFLKQVKTMHLDKPFEPENLRALVRDRVRLVRKG